MIKLIMIKSILDRHDNRRQDAGFSHDRWCRLWAKSEKQKRRGTSLGNWGQDSGPRFSFTFVQYILNVGPREERGGIKRPLPQPQPLAGNSHCLGILTAASRICTWHQINPMLRRSQASCRDNYKPTKPPQPTFNTWVKALALALAHSLTWTQWSAALSPSCEQHCIACRAADKTGFLGNIRYRAQTYHYYQLELVLQSHSNTNNPIYFHSAFHGRPHTDLIACCCRVQGNWF